MAPPKLEITISGHAAKRAAERTDIVNLNRVALRAYKYGLTLNSVTDDNFKKYLLNIVHGRDHRGGTFRRSGCTPAASLYSSRGILKQCTGSPLSLSIPICGDMARGMICPGLFNNYFLKMFCIYLKLVILKKSIKTNPLSHEKI